MAARSVSGFVVVPALGFRVRVKRRCSIVGGGIFPFLASWPSFVGPWSTVWGGGRYHRGVQSTRRSGMRGWGLDLWRGSGPWRGRWRDLGCSWRQRWVAHRPGRGCRLLRGRQCCRWRCRWRRRLGLGADGRGFPHYLCSRRLFRPPRTGESQQTVMRMPMDISFPAPVPYEGDEGQRGPPGRARVSRHGLWAN